MYVGSLSQEYDSLFAFDEEIDAKYQGELQHLTYSERHTIGTEYASFMEHLLIRSSHWNLLLYAFQSSELVL